MRDFFVAAMASFAITAAVCAIAAITVWLWHLDMGRAHRPNDGAVSAPSPLRPQYKAPNTFMVPTAILWGRDALSFDCSYGPVHQRFSKPKVYTTHKA